MKAKGRKGKKPGTTPGTTSRGSPRGKKAQPGPASRATRAQRLAAVSKSISVVEEEAELANGGQRRRVGKKKGHTRQFTLGGTGDAMNIQLPGAGMADQLTLLDRKIEKRTQRAATSEQDVLAYVGKFLESEQKAVEDSSRIKVEIGGLSKPFAGGLRASTSSTGQAHLKASGAMNSVSQVLANQTNYARFRKQPEPKAVLTQGYLDNFLAKR